MIRGGDSEHVLSATTLDRVCSATAEHARGVATPGGLARDGPRGAVRHCGRPPEESGVAEAATRSVVSGASEVSGRSSRPRSAASIDPDIDDEFDDKGGRRIVLRPEGTAATARAFIQHRPPTPWKVWYAAPGPVGTYG